MIILLRANQLVRANTSWVLQYVTFTLSFNLSLDTKVICFVDKLLELVGDVCRSCGLQSKTTARVVGCILLVKSVCSQGHTFSWSSPVLMNSNNAVIYKGNLVFAAALLLSGNNYYKIRQFCRFMGLRCISPTTYYRYQRLCFSPAIQKYYDKQMVSYIHL